MINPKVEIQFITHGHYAHFGRIYDGKRVITAKSIAEKAIRNKVAKYPEGATPDGGPEFSSRGVESYVQELNENGLLSTAQIAEIVGTGKGDKITKGDVTAFLEAQEPADNLEGDVDEAQAEENNE